MNLWQLQEVIEKSGIEAWGAGYFSINSDGDIVCSPTGDKKFSVSLPQIVEKAKSIKVSTPLILRFPQVVKSQLNQMFSAFQNSIKEFSYSGSYQGVFPFKVNQRREFIDSIVSCGKDLNWGLEVGSKTELMAALSYKLSKDSLLICNGFKDKEFIEMAFTAASMKRRLIIVVEGPDELERIIKEAEKSKLVEECIPAIGFRMRMYSKGSGKWQKSSGAESKFGLTTAELLRSLDLLSNSKIKNRFQMLHFHVGSQITAIKRFKNALREAAQVYAKVYKLGFSPKYLNIGGGVGVDYEGSRSNSQSSVNYSLQEFANDAVYVIGDVCKNENVPNPDIITESGRVIAAYHSVIVTDIREVQVHDRFDLPLKNNNSNFSKDVHKYIKELSYILENMSSQNFSEYYHDAIEYHDDLFSLFNLGYLNLQERALAEELYSRICAKALHLSSFQKHPSEEFLSLQKLNVSKYLANFSIFQSIPDAWAIDQLFPVLPLSRHGEKAIHRAKIVDITCDSDGCLERFVGERKEMPTVNLHAPNGDPYYLGFFLVGAYQESLANEHNLFGAINEVEVFVKDNGSWEISKTTSGDPIKELLVCRNYELDDMIQSYKNQIQSVIEDDEITEKEGIKVLDKLSVYLESYPYLKEKTVD